jgi:hypothetical protein
MARPGKATGCRDHPVTADRTPWSGEGAPVIVRTVSAGRRQGCAVTLTAVHAAQTGRVAYPPEWQAVPRRPTPLRWARPGGVGQSPAAIAWLTPLAKP